MSDDLKHECGIAFIRLRKPLEYYQSNYGTWRYGLNKLYLLMEKQHNRGQDGAGIASQKLGMEPGQNYLNLVKSNASTPLKDIFEKINKPYKEIEKYSPDRLKDPKWVKENTKFASEMYLGHLRYGTFGGNDISNVHPVVRENNWKTRNLVMAGNFNLANVSELFEKLIELGQHPKGYSDIVTMLEKVGHFLDRENQKLFDYYHREKGMSNGPITSKIAENLQLDKILKGATKNWDGGYTIVGMTGHGASFVTRDPWGIRPAFYYYNDDIVVAASERPVIQTVMNVGYDEVHEVEPGTALIVDKDANIDFKTIRKKKEKKACSFERIYFSRGSDKDIYKERKQLGKLLMPSILNSIDYDIRNTVFSFIPNTAEVAYYGMMEGVHDYLNNVKKDKILKNKDTLTPDEISDILSISPRMEKIAIKDVKLRTFITEDKSRDDLVAHVYDITYGVVKKDDKLVVIDDSIVRGTTLKQSIFRILDRLGPQKIIIVSSSPQIRYPDCYGIDMARLGDLIAFNAAISLLKSTGRESIINDVYKKSKEQQYKPKEEIVNYVKEIYEPFTDEEISKRIAEMLRPDDINAETDVIYQSVDNLHKACPNHLGDWYFTGDYPTPGGNRAVNNAFINYIEKRNDRAY